MSISKHSFIQDIQFDFFYLWLISLTGFWLTECGLQTRTNRSECACKPDYIWSDEVCDSDPECCGQTNCTFKKEKTSPMCLSNTRGTVYTIVQASLLCVLVHLNIVSQNLLFLVAPTYLALQPSLIAQTVRGNKATIYSAAKSKSKI